SELYSQGVLEQLDEFGLGIVASAAVFEPRKNQLQPHLTRNTAKLKRIAEQIYKEIEVKERKFRIYPFSKPLHFNLSLAMEGWLRGTRFDKVLQMTDTDEGEVVRYFRMSVQILREISEAKVASLMLKERIQETIRVLNRDIVDAEKQLREG
ncbi:MAG: hypothetical protein NTY47_00320, partial [Candidatus Omnitrophica bacterium]|nr:hypothetical protein [Candidatus Omnitrophota bacterium]